MRYSKISTTVGNDIDVNFVPKRNYHTDVVTNIVCQYYYNEISEEDAISRLSAFNPTKLAEYILEAFNEGKLIPSNIEIIPVEI